MFCRVSSIWPRWGGWWGGFGVWGGVVVRMPPYTPKPCARPPLTSEKNSSMNAVLSTAISSSSVSSSTSCFCGVQRAVLRGGTPLPAPGDTPPRVTATPRGQDSHQPAQLYRVEGGTRREQPWGRGGTGVASAAEKGGEVAGGTSSSHIWPCTAGELRDCWAWPEGGDGDGTGTGTGQGFMAPTFVPWQV